MLDKLVESKNNHGENKRLSGFLLTTFLTVVSVLAFGLICSLFSQTLAMGNESLDVSVLAAPLPLTEQAPPPEPKQSQPAAAGKINNSSVPTRAINMQRTDESPVKPPDSISVAQNKNQARPNDYFILKGVDSNPSNGSSNVGKYESTGNNKDGLVSAMKPSEVSGQPEIERPPVIKSPVKPIIEKPKLPISGGVVNGKATNLVKPVYSAAARAVRAGGEVKVQVTIDEDGNVISANAVSGHPLLRSSAETAAKSSKFSPTTLSKEKVKVTGIIIYNFTI